MRVYASPEPGCLEMRQTEPRGHCSTPMTHLAGGRAAPHLPGLLVEPARWPYGARSDAAVLIGDLLTRHVPTLASGELDIVAIARQPAVLAKVAVRRHGRTRLSGRPVGLVVGVGADRVNRVSGELGGE